MKLIYILNDINLKNGVVKFVTSWANYFNSRGYKIEIFSLYSSNNKNPFFKIDKNVKVLNCANQCKFKNNQPTFSSVVKLGRIVNRKNADVVLVNTLSFLDALPFIKTKKIVIEHIPYRLTSTKFIIKKITYQFFYDKSICVSKVSADYYKKYIGKKSSYIPNAFFDNPKNSIKSKFNNYTCCAAGRFVFWKHFPFIVRSFKLVHDKIPQAKLRLFGGDDGYESRDEETVKKIIQDNHMEKYVKICGYVNDVQKEMSKCDTFLFASDNKEAFGFVLVEAMSAGLPIIAVESETTRNLLSTAFSITTSRDEKEFANAIIETLSSNDKLTRMSKNSLIEAKKYGADTIAKEWYKLFE